MRFNAVGIMPTLEPVLETAMPSTASRPLVVIVEADPALADTLAMLIDDWGFRALHCASAKTAIRALGTGLGDVAAIITDYQPLDGFAGIGEASRIMAATGRRIPTIVTSGHPFLAEHQDVFPVDRKSVV